MVRYCVPGAHVLLLATLGASPSPGTDKDNVTVQAITTKQKMPKTTELFPENFQTITNRDLFGSNLSPNVQTSIDNPLCTKELALAPASAIKGSYLTSNADLALMESLIVDFSDLILHHSVSVASADPAEEVSHLGYYMTNNAHTCALSLTGISTANPRLVSDQASTVMNCILTNDPRHGDSDHFCVCFAPDLGLSKAQCLNMLKHLAKKTKRTIDIDFDNVTNVPRYIELGKSMISLHTNNSVVCSDSQLKLSALTLYENYQIMITLAEQIAEMYHIELRVLQCDHDLASLTSEGLQHFANCVKYNSARTSREFDLFAAFGLRPNYGEYVKKSNSVIRQNFVALKRREDLILKTVAEDAKRIQSFLNREENSLQAVANELKYLRAQQSFRELSEHNRREIVSAYKTISYSFGEIHKEFRKFLEISLSPISEKNILCLSQGTCIDTRSILTHRKDKRVTVSARESYINMIEVYRISCYLFQQGDKIYRHALTDVTALELDGSLVARDGYTIIAPACLIRGQNCHKPHSVVNPDELIRKTLYLSAHKDRLYAQCITNESLTFPNDITSVCNMSPTAVKFPFGLREKIIDGHHGHYFVSGFNAIAHFDAKEIDTFRFKAKHPSLKIADLLEHLNEPVLDLSDLDLIRMWGIGVPVIIGTLVLICCCLGCCFPSQTKTCIIKSCSCCKIITDCCSRIGDGIINSLTSNRKSQTQHNTRQVRYQPSRESIPERIDIAGLPEHRQHPAGGGGGGAGGGAGDTVGHDSGQSPILKESNLKSEIITPVSSQSGTQQSGQSGSRTKTKTAPAVPAATRGSSNPPRPTQRGQYTPLLSQTYDQSRYQDAEDEGNFTPDTRPPHQKGARSQ